MERAHPCLKPCSKWMKAVSQPFVFMELDSTALAQVIIESHVSGASKMVCWLKMPRVGRSRQPNCLTVGGRNSGGHVISRLLMSCDRISIKLQLIGKSRLIFQFYHMTRRQRSHETLKLVTHTTCTRTRDIKSTQK